jgi:drug/metabolite transporter (DMT)-like permease
MGQLSMEIRTLPGSVLSENQQAAYSLLLKRRPMSLPPTVTLAASMMFGVVLMLPVLSLNWPAARLVPSPGIVLSLGYIVAFPSVIAFWLWGFGVGRMGPERAGQFIHLMPIFGPVLAMAILGERIAVTQAIGAVIVFAGVAVVVWGGKR